MTAPRKKSYPFSAGIHNPLLREGSPWSRELRTGRLLTSEIIWQKVDKQNQGTGRVHTVRETKSPTLAGVRRFTTTFHPALRARAGGGFRLLPARVVRAPLACVAGAGLGGAGITLSRVPALRRVSAPARAQNPPLTLARPPTLEKERAYHPVPGVVRTTSLGGELRVVWSGDHEDLFVGAFGNIPALRGLGGLEAPKRHT